MLLQKGAAAGLTPYQIGTIMCRASLTKSPLEKLHANALRLSGCANGAAAAAGGAFDEPAYLNAMRRLVDDYLADAVLDGQAADVLLL